jgi:colicin import membrane protein
MIRKIAHSILRAPAETESPTATNVPPDSRGPNSRAWMSKIGRLEPTEEPPAKKEDDDASTKTADGGSDPDRPANAPGVDADPNPGTDASNAAAAANAIAAKKKAVTEAKAKADAEAAAAKAAKPDATAAGEGEESYDIEKEAQPRTADDWGKYKRKYSTRLKTQEEAKEHRRNQGCRIAGQARRDGDQNVGRTRG